MNTLPRFANVCLALAVIFICYLSAKGARHFDAVSEQGPNGWIYHGARNDTVFVLIVRKIPDGVEGTLLVNSEKNYTVCYDTGIYSALSEPDLLEVDGLMEDALNYEKYGVKEYSKLRITLPENYSGEKESNSIGRYARYTRIPEDGKVMKTPIMELCP